MNREAGAVEEVKPVEYSEETIANVARILYAAGWRDTCDAQWAGLEKALSELREEL